MKKKMFFSMLLSFMMCLFFSGTSFARESFTITKYNIDVKVHTDSTFSISEQIDCNFTSQKHGIYRYLPTSNSLNIRDKNGVSKEYIYNTDISNINTHGESYDTDNDNGNLIIKLGSADRYVSGNKTYNLDFLYSTGDDRNDLFDLFYYNIIGFGWDTTIDNITFNVTFDKACDMSKLQTFYGKVGSTNNENVNIKYNEKGFSGSLSHLNAKEALTVKLVLPEGYYANVKKFNQVFPYVFIVIIVILIIIGILLLMAKSSHQKVVQTIEFYPPEDISSADVGYIIDNSADDKDFISLIIWFANKGYLKITQKEGKKSGKEDIILEKLKEVPENYPKHLRLMYKALFGNVDAVNMKNLSTSFYNRFNEAKGSISSVYTGKKSLTKKGITILSGFLLVLTQANTIFASLAAGGNIDITLFIITLFAAASAIAFGFVFSHYKHNSYFVKKTASIITFIIAVLINIGAILINMSINTFVPDNVFILYEVLGLVGVIVYGSIHTDTDYRIEMTGKLLGLKDFIQNAELPKLEALVEENPEYFYNILPYAYVFGLTNKWIKKFENIPVLQPNWYYNDYDTFNMMMFMNSYNRINSSSYDTIKTVAASQAKSSVDSSGGGGFSGGGFGGGGGGSW